MKINKNIIIKGKHHKPILTDLFYIENKIRKPIVIFIHGYKGYKDWGCWNLVAEEFAKNNIFFVKFNFSHNGGTINNPIDFSDLEAFGNNNFSKELDDLDTVINWLLDFSEIQNEADKNNITLIGHSRGGGIATIKASENTIIKKLITWASVSDFEKRFPTGKILEIWKRNGVSYIENSRTKQQMPHYYQFYEDFIKNKNRLSIQKAARKVKIPHLIIHGTDDCTVQYHEAENLKKWSTNSILLTIKKGNHTFGSIQPWEEDLLSEDMTKVLENSIVFVKKLTINY